MTKALAELPESEQREILITIARNSGSATAQIQAIQLLREIQGGQQPAAEGFAVLDQYREDFRRHKAA
jgi:hypothetical protein